MSQCNSNVPDNLFRLADYNGLEELELQRESVYAMTLYYKKQYHHHRPFTFGSILIR
jgi:hypothetical protein